MRSVLLLLSGIVSLLSLHGQVERPMNLQNFDGRKYHFGFMLGYNQASFYLNPNLKLSYSDSIRNIRQRPQPGFDLIIVGSFNPTPNINFRFTPGLSFQDRWLDYTFMDTLQGDTWLRKKIESTYLNFPLLLKLRTNRINNFAAYAVMGYYYALDMANNRDFENNGPLRDQNPRITKADHGYVLGLGTDFFLQYFKFGIELKLHAGIKNILIQDNSFFVSPVQTLRTRCWTLALTFEG